MRIPSQSEYQTAKAALAVYADYCKPYLQRNGWTVIPADAPRPRFEGAEMSTDQINAFSTTVELFELDRDKPAAFSAYVSFPRNGVTTWTGEEIGTVCNIGDWRRNNMGGKWRSIRVRSAWGAVYHGREYDSRQLINLRLSRA
jgi:hypothetical protein